MKEAPAGTETKAAYLARLRTAAQGLPRAFVQSVVGLVDHAVHPLLIFQHVLVIRPRLITFLSQKAVRALH